MHRGVRGSTPRRSTKKMNQETKEKDTNKTFEIKIRFFGNEMFAVALNTENGSNRWIVMSILTIFCFLTVLGAYGEKFVELYKMVVGP